MLRWSHHVDIFGTLHFIVRCLADRSEGPLTPCSCRRRRCSCTPPASASSPTPAKDIESRPNHVNSWSPAREEPMDGAPFSLSPGCQTGPRGRRTGDHELTWLGRDSMSFADVGEDAEAGGVQLHRRRRQLQGGSGPSDRSARHRTKNAGSRKCLHGGTFSTLPYLMYVQDKSVYMVTVDHMMTLR